MAYFADLTSYCYIRRYADPCVLNVGWLDNQHSFPKGTVPDTVLATLFALCKKPVNMTRGMHSCQFCPGSGQGRVAERNGIQIGLGAGEIRVKGLSAIEYASPTMIYHYMKEHGYHPPQEFIDAVSRMEVT